jgi:hypothetical protein
VTLRVPPPLDTELSVSGDEVRHGDTLVASLAWPDAPPAVTGPVIYADSGPYPGFAAHPFPTCYVCGPDRPDGLRIFPGRLPDGRTAASWTVPDDVGFATVWAALDCPGGWTVLDAAHPYLLGRIAAIVSELPKPGAVCVVAGEATARSGRKATVVTTLYGPDGAIIAGAGATWIAVA